MIRLTSITVNDIAVFTVFSNFVLNAIISFVIWWRVLRPHVPRSVVVNLSTENTSPHDTTFKLVGLLFTVLACSFLLAAMWRAKDITWELFTFIKIGCNSVFFSVSLYALYSMIYGSRLKVVIPTVLGSISMTLAGLYVWLSV